MPRAVTQKQRVSLILLKDYDFSSVTKEDAKLVWFWEICRQYMANGYEPIPKGEKALSKRFLATPYTKLTTKELSDWYATNFGFGRLPTHAFKDGTVMVQNDIRPVFKNADTRRKPILPMRRFAFDIQEYTPPQEARKYVMRWLCHERSPHRCHPGSNCFLTAKPPGSK